MRKNLVVRSLAVVSGLAMLASLAACGDNAPANSSSNSSSSSNAKQLSGEFAGAGASSQKSAVDAWMLRLLMIRLAPALV